MVIRPIIESLFPRAAIDDKLPAQCTGSSKDQQYSLDHLRLLTYAATNNFAGVQELVSLPMMYEYLKPMMLSLHSPETHALVKVASFPSTKPMVENFFRCAVEAGDDRAVRALCSSSELALNPNDQICGPNGTRYTAVERAAELKHLTLTKLLVAMGVDVNKTYQDTQYLARGAREGLDGPRIGALEWALHDCKPTSLILDLVSALLQVGGSLRPGCIEPFLRPEWAQLLQLLIPIFISEYHRSWNEMSLFHQAAHQLDQDTLLFMYRQMHSVDADFGYMYWSDKLAPVANTIWRAPSHLRTLIDITAWRGDLALFQTLAVYGASLTSDTLTAAVQSRNLGLVQFLLAHGADADCFSPTLFSNPYAEALRVQEHDLILLVETYQSTNPLSRDGNFCAVLAAASEIGDIGLVYRLLSAEHNKDPGILGYALTRAALKDHTDVALILLHAGAVAGEYTWEKSFGNEDKYPMLSPLHPTYYPPSVKLDPLRSAVLNQNATLVRALLDHDMKIVPGSSALAKAVEWGDQSVLKDIIYAIENDMRTSEPVAVAVKNGDLSIVRLLLDAGFSIGTGRYDANGLLEAVKTGDFDMVQELLKYGAGPECPAALLEAMDVSPAIFRFLIREFRGRYPSVHGNFALVLSKAIQNGQKDILQSLLDNPTSGRVDIWEPDDDRCREAIQEGIASCAEKTQRSPMQAFDPNGIATHIHWDSRYNHELPQETLLLVAIASNQLDMVQLLIERGAHVNWPANRGIKRTPLQKAAEVGAGVIIQFLLDRGADINAAPAERGGGTALQLASAGGYIGIVELLLQHGADITAPPSKVDGRSPIEGAAEHGRFDMVHFLIKRCPPKSEQLQSAMELATKNGHSAIAEVLKDELATVNLADSNASSVQRPLCNVCQMSFSNSSARSRHMRTAHRRSHAQTDHVCSVCSRVFRRKDNMERHESTHRKSGSMYVRCELCGNKFRKDYLGQHLTSCQQRHSRIMEID